ncbi:glutamate-1-semialdehyde 2,1-aminomutase [uncultured Capnocytophaga sp.]|jgi:glutamate-1-semialdehyde-2,1-aminomutase|uniref:glutamate-1-semialdehyde 2,1-aminomutase n=1 Tax=uncultured Capnocytophaga sp. TaxID=159273 RepID=UPI0028EEC368|nr:glutamate-1-semialdehyde 2,1-aminomutase [uncultured Capnocytophaga sp.]
MLQYKRSSELFKQAQQVLPGGVNSPVRAFNAVGGTPIFVEKAQGAYLYDADGNKLIDYIASWGPLLFGHAYAPVIEAVTQRAKKGTSFGMPTEVETLIAQKALSMVPNVDKIRFVNSGTEACMSAIRLARGYTKRDKIIKFSGCYHGHSDSFLIAAGSGATTFGVPNSPGVTQGTAKDTLLANYNDIDSVKELFVAYPGQIAALIIEPIAGNMGCVLPKEGFLEALRAICTEHGALFIMDEVMTGFRLAKGGAQEALHIQADIVTFGKVIGGGLPVAAFAARTEIMDHLAPVGAVYQAGTLSGNPLAMSAGLAMLEQIENQPEVFESLDKKTAYLQEGIQKLLTQAGIPHQVNRFGSMCSVFFTEEPVTDFASAQRADHSRFKKYFHAMLSRGIYLPPSGYESYFLNDALSYADLDTTLEALREALASGEI